MKKIVIIGGGGHSKVLINILKRNSEYCIIGYVDITNNGNILGIKYIGRDDVLIKLFDDGVKYAALGVGQVKLTIKRFNVLNRLKEIGFNFPIIISSSAIVNEDVNIEEGTQVFDGVVINSGTKIGKHTIINTNSTLEHDCKIGNYCHIATGAILCGGVDVGDFSMIGSNAVIIQYKKIATNCLIGSGSVVTKNINESGVYVGNPVKKIDKSIF